MPLFALASGSPRRREMLEWTGWDFVLHPVDVDESRITGEGPDQYVARLAQTKARAAMQTAITVEADYILAADTTVADGGQVLGKPADEEDARRMLTQLRGRAHQVYTALAVCSTGDGQWAFEDCCSQVRMRAYSHEEIEAYIRSGDPMDKAGAYAIQHTGFHPVINFNGCFANVMGLPLCHLVRLMRKFGVESPIDTALSCQHHLEYDCSVTRDILAGSKAG